MYIIIFFAWALIAAVSANSEPNTEYFESSSAFETTRRPSLINAINSTSGDNSGLGWFNPSPQSGRNQGAGFGFNMNPITTGIDSFARVGRWMAQAGADVANRHGQRWINLGSGLANANWHMVNGFDKAGVEQAANQGLGSFAGVGDGMAQAGADVANIHGQRWTNLGSSLANANWHMVNGFAKAGVEQAANQGLGSFAGEGGGMAQAGADVANIHGQRWTNLGSSLPNADWHMVSGFAKAGVEQAANQG